MFKNNKNVNKLTLYPVSQKLNGKSQADGPNLVLQAGGGHRVITPIM